MSIRIELVRKLDEAREKMRMVKDLAAQNQAIYPPWTIKQVVDHLTGWDDITIQTLRAHIRGEVPLTPAARGIDYYNAGTVAEREPLDFDHSLGEWDATRDELKRVLMEMPEERFNATVVYPWGPKGSVARLILIFVEHEEEHAEEIKEILEKARTGL